MIREFNLFQMSPTSYDGKNVLKSAITRHKINVYGYVAATKWVTAMEEPYLPGPKKSMTTASENQNNADLFIILNF
jgi:hypothetical protein